MRGVIAMSVRISQAILAAAIWVISSEGACERWRLGYCVMFTLGVVGWGDFDNVGADDLEA